MNDKNDILRNIPQVETILQGEGVAACIGSLGRAAVVAVIHEEIDRFRKAVGAGEKCDPAALPALIENAYRKKELEKIRRVINGTGVVIHTNLGRAPLDPGILRALADEMSGYCNLEYFLPARKRGKRGEFAEELICGLTAAEDALIVNNNASSVFLILSCHAKGREVVVSRGELIQIGGGFASSPSMTELASLKRPGVIVARDMGSGNLLPGRRSHRL